MAGTTLRDSSGRFRGSTKGWRKGVPRGRSRRSVKQIRGAQALTHIGPTIRSPRPSRIPVRAVVGAIVVGTVTGTLAARQQVKRRNAARRRAREQANRQRT